MNTKARIKMNNLHEQWTISDNEEWFNEEYFFDTKEEAVEFGKTYEDFTITDPKERQKHFGQYDHVRWYGMDYFERLKSVGFSVDINFYSQKFSEQEQKRFGLNVTEILPVVRK